MSRAGRLVRKAARLFHRIGDGIASYAGGDAVWFDVGAHHGEKTFGYATENPRLKVYAFEPNLAAAVKVFGRASNFFVTPMAVSETDGLADFYLNEYEDASSLLPFNETALRSFIGGEALKVKSVVRVPTIRLDTFMNLTNIRRVDYLKIDAQGMDLAVVKSLGARLSDVRKISLEVDVTPGRAYLGSASKEQVLAFLGAAGFVLVETESQTYGQEENLTFARRVAECQA